MNQGTQVVLEGMEQAQQSGSAFHDIVNAIGKISSQSSDVSEIVQEVNASIHDMSIIMTIASISQQATQNTQDVAASVEEQNASMGEIASAAEHLGDLAEELKILIGNFKV